jgi:hypothetical protein
MNKTPECPLNQLVQAYFIAGAKSMITQVSRSLQYEMKMNSKYLNVYARHQQHLNEICKCKKSKREKYLIYQSKR